MDTVAGVFKSQADAERAVQGLLSVGIKQESIALLAPGSGPQKARKRVTTSDTEQPGMGTAVGGVVGGAVGVAGGTQLGAALIAATLPGVGPVIGMGLLGGAILGLAGAKIGNVVEDAMSEGLPADELFVYEDALRQGRSVVVVSADEDRAEPIRKALENAGAESIDAARKQWWIGLRDAEKENYRVEHRTFDEDENFYRAGFEAALDARNLDRGYDEVFAEQRMELERNWDQDSRADVEEAFRLGYERGLAYYQNVRKEAA